MLSGSATMHSRAKRGRRPWPTFARPGPRPRDAPRYGRRWRNYEQALVALSELPESRGTAEQAFDLRLDLRYALYPLGEIAGIREHLQAAAALAQRLADPRRLGWVAVQESNYCFLVGDNARGVAAAE